MIKSWMGHGTASDSREKVQEHATSKEASIANDCFEKTMESLRVLILCQDYCDPAETLVGRPFPTGLGRAVLSTSVL